MAGGRSMSSAQSELLQLFAQARARRVMRLVEGQKVNRPGVPSTDPAFAQSDPRTNEVNHASKS
jgi:hypothetical protein